VRQTRDRSGSKQSPEAKREPLYKGLFHTVRRRIELGQLKPGTRAPSESDLIFEFHVSSTTARRCLNDLETAGYVERVQGKGTFVKPPPALVRTRQIGVLYNELFSLGETFLAKELYGIAEGMRDAEFQPALLAGGLLRRSANPAAALVELIKLHGVEALIILSPIPQAWLSLVLENGLAVASINFSYQDSRIASAVPDVDTAYQRMFERLASQGHRRIVEITRTFPQELLEGVKLTRHTASKPDTLDWRSESYPYFEPSMTRRIVERQLASANPPTAFVGLGYEIALEIRETVRSLGKRVPQDISTFFVGVPTAATDLAGEIVPVEEMAAWTTRLVLSAVEQEKISSGPRKVFATKSNPGTTLAKVK
jgi:DNA-binding LacI/PurR family transcriptional regulator